MYDKIFIKKYLYSHTDTLSHTIPSKPMYLYLNTNIINRGHIQKYNPYNPYTIGNLFLKCSIKSILSSTASTLPSYAYIILGILTLLLVLIFSPMSTTSVFSITLLTRSTHSFPGSLKSKKFPFSLAR